MFRSFFRPKSRRPPAHHLGETVLRFERLEPRSLLANCFVHPNDAACQHIVGQDIEPNDGVANAQDTQLTSQNPGHFTVSGGRSGPSDNGDSYSVMLDTGDRVVAESTNRFFSIFDSRSGRVVNNRGIGGELNRVVEFGRIDAAGTSGRVYIQISGPDPSYELTITVLGLTQQADIKVNKFTWNTTIGGADIEYEVSGGTLDRDTTIGLYWANGPSAGNQLKEILSFPITIPAGTQPGRRTFNVQGSLLHGAPAGTTHLVAVADPNNLYSPGTPPSSMALADVRVAIIGNAAAKQAEGYVIAGTVLEKVKGLLREAGESDAIVTSTVRTASEQAAAMFKNALTEGIPSQYDLYGPSGDLVIKVYEEMTAGMTKAQIKAKANQTAIIAAMTAKINEVGPRNVSRHCASLTDWNQENVVDIAASSIANRALLRAAGFRTLAVGELTRFIPWPEDRKAYHVQARP